MSQQVQTIPIDILLPSSLGLTDKQVKVLEEKWQRDLTDAVEENAGHSKISVEGDVQISIHIHFGGHKPK